jgi:hypothetical protein
MVLRPVDHSAVVPERFPGELPESFESTMATVKRRPAAARGIGATLRRLLGPLSGRLTSDRADSRRSVAFDGYRSDLYDEKRERDRRYGTVYSVTEAENAYIVSLEFPRRLPISALRNVWNLRDEMPDYGYDLKLEPAAMIIRAGVPGEASRRLAYVSPSFPADFFTRIEFEHPVLGFSHRLDQKVLTIVVLKATTQA